LVATDLFGRGIDIERVNIVINYDMADDSDSYLHRVGRAGRFGTKGLAISFISSPEDSEVLNQVQSRFEINITPLPETIDVSSYSMQASLYHSLIHHSERISKATSFVPCLQIKILVLFSASTGSVVRIHFKFK